MTLQKINYIILQCKTQHTFHNLMIKSGFRQLHFLGKWYYTVILVIFVTKKRQKILPCLKIIKQFFSILFSRIQQSFYSKLKKNQKKETGKWFFIYILRLIARRFLSKTKADILKWRSIQYKFFPFNVLLAISKKF